MAESVDGNAWETSPLKDAPDDKDSAKDVAADASKNDVVKDAPPIPAPPVEREPTASNPADCDNTQPNLHAWNNGSGVYAEDSASAWVSSPESSCATTCVLHAYHYDFSTIPDNAIINGIRLRAKVKWSGKLTNFCKSTYIDWGCVPSTASRSRPRPKIAPFPWILVSIFSGLSGAGQRISGALAL